MSTNNKLPPVFYPQTAVLPTGKTKAVCHSALCSLTSITCCCDKLTPTIKKPLRLCPPRWLTRHLWRILILELRGSESVSVV